MLVVLVIRALLGKMIKLVAEPPVEKIGGTLAGGLHAAILVLIIFVACNLVRNDALNRLFGEESVIGRFVVEKLPAANEKLHQVLKTDAGDETCQKSSPSE
jgi:hypothetical protein